MQSGTLHKNNENRVTVEFQNNDAVLFIDGQHFHRSFKRLRHIRLLGDSDAAGATAVADCSSPPVARAADRHDIEKAAEVLAPNPFPSSASPDDRNFGLDGQLDIVVDDDGIPQREVITGFDINNLLHEMDTVDEIAIVDINEDDLNTGRNAAVVLRAQVNAEGKEERPSTSSGSGGSENSGSSGGSGSASSSSDSESSDGDTVDSI